MKANSIYNLSSRKGIVTVKRRILIDLQPAVLKAIFSKFFPLHIETNFFRDELKYSGISPDFEPVDEACACPEYTLTVIQEGNRIKVEFTKAGLM